MDTIVKNRCLWPVMALALSSGMATAQQEVHQHIGELKVIHSGGNTIDARQYYKSLTTQETQAKTVMSTTVPLIEPKPTRSEPVSMEEFFPIKTQGMGPGEPQSLRVNNLYSPFFIISMDNWSVNWMRQNYAALSEMRAYGVVVEADDWAKWEAVKSEALSNGITLTLLPGDELASMYGIDSYPVLIQGNR